MRPWIIVGVTILAAVTNASAQSDRTAPPGISSTPNLGCQARTGGLILPSPGETTGSANLSDECHGPREWSVPPRKSTPAFRHPRPAAVSCQSSHRRAHPVETPTSFQSNAVRNGGAHRPPRCLQCGYF
jgi:hypothetical protein